VTAVGEEIDGVVGEVVAALLVSHADRVRDWQAQRPGAWGFLAGQGVVAYRRRLGRRLLDAERRRLWAALWAALEASAA
jgi:hypothetical protein